MEKKCFKCNAIKPLKEFYIHPKMKDGHLGKCKECTKSDIKALWNEDLQGNREKERLRYQRRIMDQEYVDGKHHYNHEWRKQNGRNAAHLQGRRKLKNPGICSLCSSTKFIQGHHMDYSKPLEVIWCCSACHHKFRKQSI